MVIFTYFTFSFIAWYNKTKYIGHNLLWEIFETIASLELSPPFGAKIEIIALAIIQGNKVRGTSLLYKMVLIPHKECHRDGLSGQPQLFREAKNMV